VVEHRFSAAQIQELGLAAGVVHTVVVGDQVDLSLGAHRQILGLVLYPAFGGLQVGQDVPGQGLVDNREDAALISRFQTSDRGGGRCREDGGADGTRTRDPRRDRPVF
jgi:hypothetical protein